MTLIYSVLALLAILSQVSEGLYFYLEGSERKCFLEELPKETMVTGLYSAEQYSTVQNAWISNPELRIQIVVEELPQQQVIVNRKQDASGRFTFTSVESGDHLICLSVVSNSWFDSTKTKMTLDLDFDDPAGSHHDHSEALTGLAKRIHDLNQRVQDIRREQNFQREREAEFRDQSELANSRVVWWTLLQIGVLGGICLWQMRHYKSFFVAKKLV